MARKLASLVLLLTAPLTLAQCDEIPWRTDPRQAVSEAQRTLRPIMVYVLAGSEDRDNNLQNAPRWALADPRVVPLAQRFIPLRLSRSADRDVLRDFGLSETANMMMSFVTPDGKHLGDLWWPDYPETELTRGACSCTPDPRTWNGPSNYGSPPSSENQPSA